MKITQNVRDYAQNQQNATLNKIQQEEVETVSIA
jgi:phosphomethylpyrimidine synthase